MTTLIFDTLDFSKRAQEAGFTKEQAEFQAREAANAIENKLATKNDIADLRKDLKDFENRMVIKFGGMLIAAMTLYPIISKFINSVGATQ